MNAIKTILANRQYAIGLPIVLLLIGCSNGSGGGSTPVIPDTTPPIVTSTSPARGATDLAVNSAITVTFSEPVDGSSITSSTFTLSSGVTGSVTFDGATVIFTPSSNLAFSTVYTATLTTGIKDSSGNAMASIYTWSFNTGSAPDTTAPIVSSTSPAFAANGLAVNSAITATFSEQMDGSSITNSTFTLNNGVTGSVAFDYSSMTATFTPTTNLDYLTAYTATITTGVKDAAGNAMASNYTWIFYTGNAPDNTPPLVSSTTPARGATGLSVNSAITATFSEPIDSTSISSANFTLSNGVTGSVTFRGATAIFTPATNLTYSTAYTASISSGIKDIAGNAMVSDYIWSFYTGAAPDTTAPAVSSTSPEYAATGLAVNSAITATFSEPMDGSSITNSTFTLNNGITGTVGFDYSSMTATFTPSRNLSYLTAYTAMITTGVKDAAGNAMASNYSWTFNTGSAPDITPPSVISTIPAHAVTGLPINSAITATFSEPIDGTSITSASFTLSNGVTGSVTYSGTTAIFTPASSLDYSTLYTATLTNGIKDTAGNAMGSSYMWNFYTGAAPDTVAPTVTTTSTAHAATGLAVNSAITATFSESMDGSSITNATFSLNNGATGTVGFDYGSMTATFTPSLNLEYLTTYTAAITTGVKDAAGNAMASDYTFSFNTGTAHDTGITSNQCYEAGRDLLTACSSANAISLNQAQDGMLGRDVDAASAADGKLGFSFSRICNNGQIAGTGACPSNPLLGGAASDWGCTKDNITGLMWEIKTVDGGLRDMAKIYRINNTIGDANVFVNSVNSISLCGHTDWRLPTAYELFSIVDLGVSVGPAVDLIWFPNTQAGKYWSADIADANLAWNVKFDSTYDVANTQYNIIAKYDRFETFYVRLVRAGQ